MSCGSSCGSGNATEGASGFVALDNIGRAAPEFKRSEAPPNDGRKLMVGLDVGSTTVKAVVVDPVSDEMVWHDYQRHDTKQPEKVLEFLRRMEAEAGIVAGGARVFATGSGAGNIAAMIGAKFVQEVNAVALAVEKLYPTCGSVVELGGQDAKIIIFKEEPETGRKKKIPSMNDKCAGGTGAVIDKINAKLHIPSEQLCEMGYTGLKLHPVAGKCGVFAETDINGLQKSGVPPPELMASLFEAIVQQNLSVLTRGHTLRPLVLLLGGPNTYIKGMRECWQENIPKVWRERKVALPEGADPREFIQVPKNAQYFAALGSVEFGKDEDDTVGVYRGTERLQWYIDVGRLDEKKSAGSGALSKTEEELAEFRGRYRPKPFVPARFQSGQVVEGFIGIDGGSTSTKAVLVSPDKEILLKCYQLSKGNPIEDTKDMFAHLSRQLAEQGVSLRVLGVGTTGYAKDILRDVLKADAAIVETVAHTEAALHFYPEADVICDVGGQDIKLIILQNGRVKDFKLNTQCSAGNGYFLQSTCTGFGFEVTEFADLAFQAKAMPIFGYGCAVFMQSDIVDFQRQGWKPEEILAGLAAVLPKNIWLYVSQIANLASLGKTFVLQGGTQHNLAAVKAQVDFIESRFKDKGAKPKVIVHEHCGESGAIGAAIEAHRLWKLQGRQTSFIGLEAVPRISYSSHRNEDTRCYFCKNKCLRTFLDVKVSEQDDVENLGSQTSKIPILPGVKRLIVGNSCERGLVEDVNAMREIKKGMDAMRDAHPNMAEVAARAAFRSFRPPLVADPAPRYALTKAQKSRVEAMKRRARLRIGIPRVLNQYSVNPMFSAYFESLGISSENLVYSDYTSEELYKTGAKRGAIDPCFPSKVGIPHAHNLIYVHHKKKPLDVIFFPMIDDLPSDMKFAQEHRACPTVTATPAAVKAAFTKEGDLFAENAITYLNPIINTSDERLFARQMWEEFRDILGLSPEEHQRACAEGFQAQQRFMGDLRRQGREILEKLEAEAGIGIVLLARPYHNDPGLNHEILEEFQKLGYPVLTMASLPIDEDILWRLFGEEVEAGVIQHPMDIGDVWKNSYSENTSQKVWAAKYTARHPNLVALELSSFKCGHDAPIYTVVEETVTSSGTPYFSFKDIDENKPTGSIKIRVETISYFLKRYREDMLARQRKQAEIEAQLRDLEQKLRSGEIPLETEDTCQVAAD